MNNGAKTMNVTRTSKKSVYGTIFAFPKSSRKELARKDKIVNAKKVCPVCEDSACEVKSVNCGR